MYKIKSIIQAYYGNLNPLDYEETIPERSGPIMVLDASKLHAKGQPKSTCIRNKMDWTKSQHRQTCSQCRHERHKSNCRQNRDQVGVNEDKNQNNL